MTDNNNNSPHSNTFLKNLSQKKYAWMEEASSITTPPFPANKPNNTSEQKVNVEVSPRQQQQVQHSPKKTKKQKLTPEPEFTSYNPKKQRYIKSPPSIHMNQETVPNLQNNTQNLPEMKVDSQLIENPVSNPVVENVTPRKPQPHFKYTTFPVKGYNILPTRNITSTFARNDTTYFPGHKAGAEEISPDVSFLITPPPPPVITMDLLIFFFCFLFFLARGRMERHDYYSPRFT